MEQLNELGPAADCLERQVVGKELGIHPQTDGFAGPGQDLLAITFVERWFYAEDINRKLVRSGIGRSKVPPER